MEICDVTHCMSPCSRGDESKVLLRANLLQTVVDSLPRPDEQRPSVLVLIGNAEKSLFTRTLFSIQSGRSAKTKRKSCEIYAHVDPFTASSDRPLLLLDWNVRKSCDKWSSTKRNKCQDASQSVINPLHISESRSYGVDFRLLSPFTDVFCFFSADLGGFRQVAQCLARWLEQGQSSTLPERALPRVVIVTSKIPPTQAAEKEATKAFLHMLMEETPRDPDQQLPAVDVIALKPKDAAAATTTAKARIQRAKEQLCERAKQMQQNREKHHVSFSATHVNAFFERASAHFTKSAVAPFDFVRASRTFNSVAPDMHEHFSAFLKHITSTHQLTNFIAPMIASSLLLDSYPPDAHGR
jgi:hypothetical protein